MKKFFSPSSNWTPFLLSVGGTALCMGAADVVRISKTESVDFESIRNLTAVSWQLFLFPFSAALLYATPLRAVMNWNISSSATPKKIKTIGVTIAASVIPIFLGASLFSGRAISQSMWRFPLMTATCTAIAVVIHGLLRMTPSALVAMQKSSHRRRQFAVGALPALYVLILLAGMWTTETFFPGLYTAFHQLITLGIFAVLSLLNFIIIQTSFPHRLQRRLLIGAVSLICILSTTVFLVPNTNSALGRYVLIQHAPYHGSFTQLCYSLYRSFFMWSDDSPRSQRSALPYDRIVAGEAQKNVLLITVDALRGDVLNPKQKYGRAFSKSSAELDKCIEYTTAYSPGNHTSISIPAILIGQQNPTNEVAVESSYFSAVFNRLGYTTDAVFTTHDYLELRANSTLEIATRRGFFFQIYDKRFRRVDEVLQDVQRRMNSGAFPKFIWMHLSDVHYPYYLAPKRGKDSNYLTQLMYLDAQLAKFFRYMKSANSDWVWAFTSDHGEALGDHGYSTHGTSMYDSEVRVPMVLCVPGRPGKKIHTPVSTLTLLPTLLTAAGASVPKEFARLPPVQAPQEVPFVITGRQDQCAIRYRSWKLILVAGAGSAALYNLQEDPGETRNVLQNHMDMARRLQKHALRACLSSPLF